MVSKSGFHTPEGGALFIIIDEDSIDNDLEPFTNGSPILSPPFNPPFNTHTALNEDVAFFGIRAQLRWWKANIGATIVLRTGQMGDEAWFAVPNIPQSWEDAVPINESGLSKFIGDPGADPDSSSPHGVGEGLGAPPDPESLLDKIDHVTPLRASGLVMLEGHTLCAVVYDSDVDVNYDNPINGNLKGANLGTVAFEVLTVTKMDPNAPALDNSVSSSTLPKVALRVLDAEQVCAGPLTTSVEGVWPPVLESSSEVFDIDPKNPVVGGTIGGGLGGGSGSITFSIVTENSLATATNVVMEDTLPGTGWTIVSTDPTCFDPVPAAGGNELLRCEYDDLEPGEVRSVTVVNNIALTDCIKNTATVSADNEDPASNNSDMATVCPGDLGPGPGPSSDPNPSIRIIKTPGGHSNIILQIAPGAQVQYHYSVENTGDVALTNVVVSDDNGPGTRFEVDIGDLAVGQTAHVHSPLITITDPPTCQNPRLNTAVVVGSPFATDQDSAEVCLLPAPPPSGGDDHTTIVSSTVGSGTDGFYLATASCADGEWLLGGGFSFDADPGNPGLSVHRNGPDSDGSGLNNSWVVIVHYPGSSTATLTAYAICAKW